MGAHGVIRGGMTNIRCSAIVDPVPGDPGLFDVTVFTPPPDLNSRVYEVRAASDTIAAQEGIRRFVEEMERTVLHGAPSCPPPRG
jgi:hypothetical protein